MILVSLLQRPRLSPNLSHSYPAEPWIGSIIKAAIFPPSTFKASHKSSISPNRTVLPDGDVDPTCGTYGP